MKNFSRKNQHGFTLFETVIVLFLFSVMLVALFVIFDRHNTIYNFEAALVKANGSARTVMTEINNYGLQAHRVLSSQVVNGTNYNSGVTVLVLQLPAVNGSGNIIPNTWDYVVFYTNTSQVWEQIQAGSGSSRTTGSKLLTSSLSSLTFTYDDPSYPNIKKITIDLKTQETYKTQIIKVDLPGEIRLRNY